MKFILIDKIVKIVPGKEIQTVKNVSLSEEYLADHFPTFPVLPGVFLLQGLVESACWLVRETENFAHSMVLLAQAKNVKYKSFAAPGYEYSIHRNGKGYRRKYKFVFRHRHLRRRVYRRSKVQPETL